MSPENELIYTSLKQFNPVQYLSVLYLPQEIRDDIATLWAFDCEISRIPDLVSEPMPGEIRIQWWRDLIKSGGQANQSPLSRSLMDVVSRHQLPRETLDIYLQAKIFDLYQDTMPNVGTLEGYLGETKSSLFQLAALCAGAQRSGILADACGHAGMATGLSDLLSYCAKHRARNQLFLPTELLESQGLELKTWFEEDPDERHSGVILEVTEICKEHLRDARTAIANLDQSLQPVFLSLATIDPLLGKLQKPSDRCFSTLVSLSPIRQHWTVFRAAMRGSP